MLSSARTPASLAFTVLLTATMGCGGSLPDVAVPKDPTPLTKCKVAASVSSPLVTEWPASEKARLEGLLSEGGVAVSYSGCEMSILDGCKVDGSYAFQRTTLSTDTIEIQDQDDLYAKLPLGAVSLEGELSRSGRLAIRTTVAGQVKFKGDVAKISDSGVCAKASHVVTGISVGAFKMLSGGAVSAGGGVDVAGAGTGAKTSRAEETLRQAGDPEACSNATAEAADPGCNSPIQVFLTPVQKKPGTPGYVAPEAEDKPLPDSVRMTFADPADSGGKWVLREENGKSLCELPCSRWISIHGTYVLQLDSDSGVQTVKMPKIEYAPGRNVNTSLLPPRGSRGLGLAATIVGSIGTGLGLGALAFLAAADAADAVPIAGAVAGGSGALMIGGIVLLAYSRSSYKVDFKLAEGKDSASIRQDMPTIRLGPGSVQGTFF